MSERGGTMNLTIPGIHHITVVASDPQRNLDFYTQVLGMRLIKLTVNFDMNETYHFYFADETGTPGTVLTFFPWGLNTRKGTQGAGQAVVTAFSIPEDSVSYWSDRLELHGVSTLPATERDGMPVVRLLDPDGMQIDLVANAGTQLVEGMGNEIVPAQYALRGFYGTTLLVNDLDPSANLLADVFNMRLVHEERDLVRFEAGVLGQPGRYVDILQQTHASQGRMGAGAIHHIAFRTPDDTQQLMWREKLISAGFQVTPVRDRSYFHSIYFNEPGGVLFEIATDLPGFAIDEPVECLGTALKLPPWLEPRRAEISGLLEPLRLPSACPETA
jgi:glyoxalase family protein